MDRDDNFDDRLARRHTCLATRYVVSPRKTGGISSIFARDSRMGLCWTPSPMVRQTTYQSTTYLRFHVCRTVYVPSVCLSALDWLGM